jgi:hypothetical protein
MPNVSNDVGSAQCRSSPPTSTGARSAVSISHATIASRVASRCCCAIERRIPVLGQWHGHQVGEQPHALGAGQGPEAAAPDFELCEVLLRGILRLPAEHALQMFDDRMKCARRVKGGAAHRHPNVVLAARLSQRFQQTGLADPGLLWISTIWHPPCSRPKAIATPTSAEPIPGRWSSLGRSGMTPGVHSAPRPDALPSEPARAGEVPAFCRGGDARGRTA